MNAVFFIIHHLYPILQSAHITFKVIITPIALKRVSTL